MDPGIPADRERYFSYTRREILPLLPDRMDRVLEVGCGVGNTLCWLKEDFGCRWIGGIEIDPAAAGEARRRLDFLFEGDVSRDEIPEMEPVDLLLCLDVLEHLVDPWAVVRRLYEIVRPGGAIIASVPNVRNRKVLLPLLFRGTWEYADEGVLDRTHLRFFVRETAIRLVESGGFRVDRVTATGFGKSRRSRIARKILPTLLTSVLERQYIIRGVKPGGAAGETVGGKGEPGG